MEYPVCCMSIQLFLYHLLKRLSFLLCIALAPLSKVKRTLACVQDDVTGTRVPRAVKH